MHGLLEPQKGQARATLHSIPHLEWGRSQRPELEMIRRKVNAGDSPTCIGGVPSHDHQGLLTVEQQAGTMSHVHDSEKPPPRQLAVGG